jgi:hypothetical protein
MRLWQALVAKLRDERTMSIQEMIHFVSYFILIILFSLKANRFIRRHIGYYFIGKKMSWWVNNHPGEVITLTPESKEGA